MDSHLILNSGTASVLSTEVGRELKKLKSVLAITEKDEKTPPCLVTCRSVPSLLPILQDCRSTPSSDSPQSLHAIRIQKFKDTLDMMGSERKRTVVCYRQPRQRSLCAEAAPREYQKQTNDKDVVLSKRSSSSPSCSMIMASQKDMPRRQRRICGVTMAWQNDYIKDAKDKDGGWKKTPNPSPSSVLKETPRLHTPSYRQTPISLHLAHYKIERHKKVLLLY